MRGKAASAARRLAVVPDKAENLLSAFGAAREAYAAHFKAHYDKRGYFIHAMSGEQAVAIEDENSTLFNRMADLEDELMTLKGERPLDSYARLAGLWSYVSRQSISALGAHMGDNAKHVEEETAAIRLTLDALGMALNRPGAAAWASV